MPSLAPAHRHPRAALTRLSLDAWATLGAMAVVVVAATGLLPRIGW